MSAGTAGVQTRHRSFQPLPQPRSLAAALLEMQLTLLGSLLAVVSQANQLQVCPSLLKAFRGIPLFPSSLSLVYEWPYDVIMAATLPARSN